MSVLFCSGSGIVKEENCVCSFILHVPGTVDVRAKVSKNTLIEQIYVLFFHFTSTYVVQNIPYSLINVILFFHIDE